MEKRLLNLFVRWLWFLTLITICAGGTAFMVVKNQPSVYQTRVRLIVGPGIDSPNPDIAALRTGGQLMQTYAELTNTGPFLQAIITKLHSNMSPNDLGKMIVVKTNQETQILTITVQGNQREEVVAIANAASQTLVDQSPSNPNSPAVMLRSQLRSQADKIEGIITASEGTIKKLETDLQNKTNLDNQRLIVDQLTEERKRQSDALSALTLLNDSLQQMPTNQVKIIEPAIQASPVVSQLHLIVLVAGCAGFILGLILVLVYEFLDNSIRTPEDLADQTNVPVLSVISRHKRLSGAGAGRLVVQEIPESNAAEDYRMLGTKLLSKYRMKPAAARAQGDPPENSGADRVHGNGEHKVRSILVGSAQIKDDTFQVAANLAIVLAQTGNRVILVDANLHKPAISELFNLTDHSGLTDALNPISNGLGNLECVPITWESGLSILPSGALSPTPFELLASPRMASLMETLEDMADIVVIAAAPLLSFASSLTLASQVDGVLLVTLDGKTRRNMIVDVIESLNSLDVNIIGTVLERNRPPRLFKDSNRGVEKREPGGVISPPGLPETTRG